jgi:hypothetical protein
MLPVVGNEGSVLSPFRLADPVPSGDIFLRHGWSDNLEAAKVARSFSVSANAVINFRFPLVVFDILVLPPSEVLWLKAGGILQEQ